MSKHRIKNMSVSSRWLINTAQCTQGWILDAFCRIEHTLHWFVLLMSNNGGNTSSSFSLGTPWTLGALGFPWCPLASGYPGHPNVPCIISACTPTARSSRTSRQHFPFGPPAAGQGPELLTSPSNIRLWLAIAAPLFPGRQVPPPLDVLKRVGGWWGSIWRGGGQAWQKGRFWGNSKLNVLLGLSWLPLGNSRLLAFRNAAFHGCLHTTKRQMHTLPWSEEEPRYRSTTADAFFCCCLRSQKKWCHVNDIQFRACS